MVTTPRYARPPLYQIAIRQPYLFALALLLFAMAVNYYLQPGFFRPAVLNGNLRTYLRTYEGRLPPELFPVAYDPGGNLIAVSTGGENAGKVYFWDHEMEDDEASTADHDPYFDNVSLIANSFDEFFNGLYEYD